MSEESKICHVCDEPIVTIGGVIMGNRDPIQKEKWLCKEHYTSVMQAMKEAYDKAYDEFYLKEKKPLDAKGRKYRRHIDSDVLETLK